MKTRALLVLLAAGVAVFVIGCGGGGGSGGGVSTLPAVTSLKPASAPVGSPGFTLTVHGAHFLKGAKVQWNGQIRTTHEVSDSVLTADIPASDLTTNQLVPITVLNSNGVTSNSINFIVGNNNPVPTITGIKPSSVKRGSGALFLEVDGTNFSQKAVVNLNGSPRQTLVQSGSTTQLIATIPSSDTQNASTNQITVTNPAPGGGISNSVPFVVTN
jgi:hypothetical protein